MSWWQWILARVKELTCSCITAIDNWLNFDHHSCHLFLWANLKCLQRDSHTGINTIMKVINTIMKVTCHPDVISPIRSCLEIEDPNYKPFYGDITSKKYIVFHNKLMELFQCCPICAGPSRGQVVNREWHNGGTNLQELRLHQDMGQLAIHLPSATWQCCQCHSCQVS